VKRVWLVLSVPLLLTGCSLPREAVSAPSTVTVTATETRLPIPTAAPAPPPPVAEPAPPVTVPVKQYGRDELLSYEVSSAVLSEVVMVGDPSPDVFVFINVWNDGKVPQSYDARYVRLIDKQGRVFEPNLKGSNPRDASINPGISIPGTMRFFVPYQTALADYSIVFHDTPRSRGVIVDLDGQ
jgi:hypothetical protein